VKRPKAGKDDGGQSAAALGLLREVYVSSIRDGSAPIRSISESLGSAPSSFRAALHGASAKKLVMIAKGSVSLTPTGRRRLKVVMVGGAFEIIHPGHIYALSEARNLGNTLVVVVATDASVERNKGRAAVTNQASRVALVSSLRQVDLAVPGNKGSIYDILVRIRPDIVAMGYDQRYDGEGIVREAAKRGVKIRTARLGSPIPDVKTSKILFSL
jgi:cytidyltransferase-like protein